MYNEPKIYCEYDELVLKELGRDICDKCGHADLTANIKDRVCADCRAIESGVYSRCSCGSLKLSQYKVCLSCKGYRRATV